MSLLTPYFKRYAARVSVGFLMLMAVDFLQLVVPRIIKDAVDDLQKGSATSAGLMRYGLYIVLLALLIGLMRFVWRNMLLGFSRLVETHLRDRLFGHILTLDRSFYQRVTAGEIMALATNDLSSVQLASGMGLVAFVDAVFMGFAAVAFMAYINPTLATVAVLPMPVLALLTRMLASKLHSRFKKVQEQFSAMTEFARSAFSSIRLLKAYNQEISQAQRFNDMGEIYVRDNLRVAAIYGTLFPISGLIANVSMLLILFFGGRMTIHGIITAGDFVAFISYLFLMTWPMMAMGWVADLFQRGATSLGRIQELLEQKPDLQDSAKERNTDFALKGDIHINNLSFTYPGQRETDTSQDQPRYSIGPFSGNCRENRSGQDHTLPSDRQVVPLGRPFHFVRWHGCERSPAGNGSRSDRIRAPGRGAVFRYDRFQHLSGQARCDQGGNRESGSFCCDSRRDCRHAAGIRDANRGAGCETVGRATPACGHSEGAAPGSAHPDHR